MGSSEGAGPAGAARGDDGTEAAADRDAGAGGDAAAVVGLGDLGIAIARRLHAVGVAVAGIDGAVERRSMWEEETGRAALASTAQIDPPRAPRAFVCVRTTEQAAAVIADLSARLGPEAVLYVVTTLAVDFARGLGDLAAVDGPRLVELPVSGGRGGAERGELVVVAGGLAVTDEDADFLSRTLASQVLRMPRYGEATLAKLLNNALAAYNALAFASAVELADGAGLDLAATAELLRRGSGGSWMADAFACLVDDLLAKDAALLAAELGPLPRIDLDDPAALPPSLARARRLLTDA
ncbi:MAG: NAD(P)-binding domain-containing protein [Solirubrobacterales bacterium]